MPSNEDKFVLCYNKGCGQTYDPDKNTAESCLHHPGAPFFHDAYKGWTCCKKKCTDFTEFLNIKGCTKSYHNNIKPEEPHKVVEKSNPEEIIEYRAPAKPEPRPMDRPTNIPFVTLTPNISNTLREQVATLKKPNPSSEALSGDEEIPMGTLCKNSSCNRPFQGPNSFKTHCIFHPGYPVFHEGLKYWTCCKKRTTDFNQFLDQPGCSIGEHVWIQPKEGNEIKCRIDWHQTSQHIVISVFAKKYDPDTSLIQLSPIRLKISLYFPEENGTFEKDMELRGVVDVGASSVQMLQTKVEIKLQKAEAITWSKLDFLTPSPPQPLAISIADVMPKPPEVDDLVDFSNL